MAEQWALVSDFDGTVSADDFFTLAAGRYFTDEMLEPWREYLSGRKKHFDALNEMFGRLRGLPDLPAFVKNIPLDSWFPETVALCHAKKIPVYICFDLFRILFKQFIIPTITPAPRAISMIISMVVILCKTKTETRSCNHSVPPYIFSFVRIIKFASLLLLRKFQSYHLPSNRCS